MSLPERRIPEWAKRERANDMQWIQENLHVLWPAAAQQYLVQGRGAIVVDITSRPTGAGNLFAYLAESAIADLQHHNALRMVQAYDPTWELVTMLLKSGGRDSTYRIGVPAAGKLSGAS